MNKVPSNSSGLSEEEVLLSRKKFGRNVMEDTGRGVFWSNLKEMVLEPMFLLLSVTSSLYFFLGEYTEGFFLLGAILLISSISFFQNSRSKKALNSLKEYTKKPIKVLRNNKVVSITTEEIVIGDNVLLEEGEIIPADGELVQSSDFAVNESILTGEAFAVTKSPDDSENNLVFQGTAVVSGQCVSMLNKLCQI